MKKKYLFLISVIFTLCLNQSYSQELNSLELIEKTQHLNNLIFIQEQVSILTGTNLTEFIVDYANPKLFNLYTFCLKLSLKYGTIIAKQVTLELISLSKNVVKLVKEKNKDLFILIIDVVIYDSCTEHSLNQIDKFKNLPNKFAKSVCDEYFYRPIKNNQLKINDPKFCIYVNTWLPKLKKLIVDLEVLSEYKFKNLLVIYVQDTVLSSNNQLLLDYARFIHIIRRHSETEYFIDLELTNPTKFSDSGTLQKCINLIHARLKIAKFYYIQQEILKPGKTSYIVKINDQQDVIIINYSTNLIDSFYTFKK